MRRVTKILIGVGVALLLVAVLVLTLVVVLRKEEWIVLERSFSGLNNHCTAEWGGSSDWRRTRCKMPFICAAARDQQKENGDPVIFRCSVHGKGIFWRRMLNHSGYCRLPLSEGEGKSCAASVHLCSTGLACDPYLKICRRLISVGGSCTEQNAFLCETGICGYAAMQTLEGEPVGGRHSLSRYCIVKDLPPGAACDRFRHCVTDCLQCVQGICKPVMTPIDQQQLLLEKQKELMLPLAVNGFSADEQQQSADSEAPPTGRHLQQARQSPWEAAVSEKNLSRQHEQVRGQQHPQEVPTNSGNKLTTQTVRRAWDQRAAEVSSLLGETLTAEDLAAFFAVPRDADGQPLESLKAEDGHEESIAGQQANWYGAPLQLQGLQQQQLPGGLLAPAGPRPLLTGSLAKRLAKLFAGVSYAFTPENQQGSFAPALASNAFGFPSAVPPPIPPGVGSAALERAAYGSSVFGSEMPTDAMSLPQQEQLAAQLQRLQQQQSLYQGGTSPFDSSLEAMEAPSGTGEASQKKSSSQDETGELEGLFFPGLPNTNALQPGLAGSPIPRPLAPLGVPPLSLQKPAVSSRLPPVLSPFALPPATIPPLGSASLGSSAMGSLPLGSSTINSLPLMPQNPSLQLPLTQVPNYKTPIGTIPVLPNRLLEYKGGCWVDRCCASVRSGFAKPTLLSRSSSLLNDKGCQPRKREGAPCVGDSARECEDRLSCVNGECSPWFTSRHASAGDPIILTDNVDLDSVCAPWQRFEIGHASHSPHLHDLMPPQMSLPSPLETPNPYGNNLAADVVRTFRKFSGRCVTLDKRSCVTDRECWGVGGFGFCDVRSRKCRSPAYPACLSMLKDLYSCLWYEGRLRETTDEYIVSQVPRTPQFLLHEAPVSVNHVQSKCIPSQVRRKRAEFLKCVQDQGFTLEKIVEVPWDWYQG